MVTFTKSNKNWLDRRADAYQSTGKKHPILLRLVSVSLNSHSQVHCWHVYLLHKRCKIPNSVTTYKKRSKNQIFGVEKKYQLDATEWFIAHLICSTCFGQFYAHHHELETICVLLPPMMCSAWLLVVGGQVQDSRLCVQNEGCCTTAFHTSSSVQKIQTPYVLFQKSFNYINSPKGCGFRACGIFVAKID